MPWPDTVEALLAEQLRLAQATPEAWHPTVDTPPTIGGCFVCFQRGVRDHGGRGDRAWAAASLLDAQGVIETAVVEGEAGAPYVPGLLALREGPLLEAAVHALTRQPEMVLVNATGRDHPRGAGLALQLGAVLDVPTIGVTHRPLLATGEWPADEVGARSPLSLGDEVVAYWVRTRVRTRPLVVHAGWRVDAATAVELIARMARGERTPQPLRLAREAARAARAAG